MLLFIIYAVGVVILTSIVYFTREKHGDFLEIKGTGLQRFSRMLFLFLIGLTLVLPNPLVPEVFWTGEIMDKACACIFQILFNGIDAGMVSFATIVILKLLKWALN